MFQGLGSHAFHDIPLVLDFPDDPGFHHFTVVGYGIVKSEDLQGGHFAFVAIGHPGQGCSPPVLVSRIFEKGDSFAGKFGVDGVGDPHVVNGVDELLRIFIVAGGDDFGHADIGRFFKDLLDRHRAMGSFAEVAVIDGAVAVFPGAVACVKHLAGVDQSVFQGDHQGHQFEG